jgi:ABC-type cobalt transport system substrate-binding protein
MIIEDLTITGEVSAAISAALHLYFNELHDDEKTVLTIKKISRRYSPWSSKIYNVTRGLNRRF